MKVSITTTDVSEFSEKCTLKKILGVPIVAYRFVEIDDDLFVDGDVEVSEKLEFIVSCNKGYKLVVFEIEYIVNCCVGFNHIEKYYDKIVDTSIIISDAIIELDNPVETSKKLIKKYTKKDIDACMDLLMNESNTIVDKFDQIDTDTNSD